MPDDPKRCRSCGGAEHYSRVVQIRDGYGPEPVPRSSTFLPAKFRVVVCGACGLTEWFALPEHLAKIRERFTPEPPPPPTSSPPGT
jgi:hypothetical protein